MIYLTPDGIIKTPIFSQITLVGLLDLIL